MQNKTPIVVLTGLGIVAAAAVAGLTRDQWMGRKAEVVATAPAPQAEQPATKTPEQQAAADMKPADLPASGTGTATTAAPAQPPADATKSEASQQTATAQPESQAEQPAATNVGEAAKVPAFDTVRVEKSGDAVIAGTAPAGADVVVKLDGKVIGQATANADGAFVVTPDAPLPAGSGALTLEARAKDAAEPTASRQSVAVIVPAADQPQEALVAVVSPDQPTKVLQKPEVKAAAQPAAAPAAEKPAKLVSIDAVDYDPKGNIVFSGQGNEGNTARLYIDNNFIGDAPVGADGHWTFSGSTPVSPGVHTLRVDGLDAEGKVVNRVEVPFFREQQNKVADATPPAPVPAPVPEAGKTDSAAAPAASESSAAPAAASGSTQPQPDATPAKPKEGRIVIQPGNNLWRISRVLYGTGAKFTTLYEANKDQIRNPNRIYPGQVFRTPDVAPASESIDPSRREPLTPEENAASGQ